MKIIITVIFAFWICQSQAQTNDAQTKAQPAHSDANARYRLFPTQNMWTFIKLDTRTGLMWQVQFDVLGDNRFVNNLNSISLVSSDEETNNRFTLYSTQNTYNFILLDQLNGRTWQVQWSTVEKNRGIIPIL